MFEDHFNDLPAATEHLMVGAVPASNSAKSRAMVGAELMGRHTHRTRGGIEVHVYRRAGKYMARGRYNRRQFGTTLGKNEADAEADLRQLLCDIDSGAFVSPSEARRRPFKHGPAVRLSLRQLCDAFVADTRKLRGSKTAQDYTSRLTPAIAFIEDARNRKRWPWSQDIDRDFAVAYRSFLHQRMTTGNGNVSAPQRTISAGQIHNHLACLATALNWGKRLDVNQLPAWFANPFTHEIIGNRPRKDPLAPSKLPIDLRIAMVQVMDRWQLTALALSLTLPNRPEDFAGLLISDLDMDRRELVFGTRLGGADFNKGRMSFRTVWPSQLDGLLRHLVAGRAEGPVIRNRTIAEGRREPRLAANSTAEVSRRLDQKLAVEGPRQIQSDNDRKDCFRRLLLDLGGVSEDQLAVAFKKVLAEARPGYAARFCELRGAVTTDMKEAGMDTVLRRYLTGHSLKGEILAAYETQNLQQGIAGYFEHIRPLLDAIAARAARLGIE